MDVKAEIQWNRAMAKDCRRRSGLLRKGAADARKAKQFGDMLRLASSADELTQYARQHDRRIGELKERLGK